MNARAPRRPILKAESVTALAWLTFVASLAILLGSCRGAEHGAKTPTPVTVIAIENGGTSKGTAYSASLVPKTHVDLSFKVNGYVSSITQVKGADGQMRIVQSGDLIKTGDTLATIRDDSYRQKVLEAHAQLQGARSTSAKEKADFARYEILRKERVSSTAEYDAAKQAYETAVAEVSAKQAALQQAQTDLNDCKLRSPLDGLILERYIEVGKLMNQSTKAFEVGDTKMMNVVFGVPDTVLPSLPEGTTLAMTVPAVSGSEFAGRITRVAAVSDPGTRLFDIELTVPNDGGRLKSGMIAALNLGRVAAAAEPVVPLRSVVRSPSDPNGYAVYTLEERDGGTFVRLKQVALGSMVGDGVAIKSGLTFGDRVVVKGATAVTDGQQVSVVP
ncbi:MAG: efflux RND transporter periplasmic adaptor subunit [Candidatus Binataceae bacterium]